MKSLKILQNFSLSNFLPFRSDSKDFVKTLTKRLNEDSGRIDEIVINVAKEMSVECRPLVALSHDGTRNLFVFNGESNKKFYLFMEKKHQWYLINNSF